MKLDRRSFLKRSSLSATAMVNLQTGARPGAEAPLLTPSVDGHIHIWERPWHNFIVGTGRAGRFDQRDLILALMDRHGVQKACVLAACDSANPHNNEFVAELCRENPGRFVMFAEIPLSGEKRDQLLNRTLHVWPAVGFRHLLAAT